MSATNKPKFFGSVAYDKLSLTHNANITHMISETDRLLRLLDAQDKTGYVKQARDFLELAQFFSRKAIAYSQTLREHAEQNADGEEIKHAETLNPATEIPSAETNPEKLTGLE